MEECSRGWLMGPFSSLKEATAFLGRQPHLCRRFALQQPNKIRAIDDLSENSVNKAHGYQDKLSLHDVDTLSSLIRYLERMYRDVQGSFVLRDSSTSEYKVHPGWKLDVGWLGKTFDLKAAYKQLCVSPQQWNFSAVVVFNIETQAPSIFYQVTLPFGATSAVLHFNRVARLLWRIGTKLFHILWCNFYDDYPCVCPAQLQRSVQAAVTLLFKVLGFEFAEEKDRPFAELFSALGMTFDVGRIPGGTSYVMNKAERVKSVTTWVRLIKPWLISSGGRSSSWNKLYLAVPGNLSSNSMTGQIEDTNLPTVTSVISGGYHPGWAGLHPGVYRLCGIFRRYCFSAMGLASSTVQTNRW